MKVRNPGRTSLEEVLAKLKELGLELNPSEEQLAARPAYGKTEEARVMGATNGGYENGKISGHRGITCKSKNH